jgi:hypothetical protein
LERVDRRSTALQSTILKHLKASPDADVFRLAVAGLRAVRAHERERERERERGRRKDRDAHKRARTHTHNHTTQSRAHVLQHALLCFAFRVSSHAALSPEDHARDGSRGGPSFVSEEEEEGEEEALVSYQDMSDMSQDVGDLSPGAHRPSLSEIEVLKGSGV